MKQSDWQRAFGQPDQAFHRAFTETLEQLEEMHMKRRYRISTLLIAAVLLTLAFAGAALATGGFGIFDRADVPPLKGAEALVETGLGRTANDLVRLTVEEAYVAGVDPTDPADDFRAAIVWAADGPRVSWSPDLRTAAQPRVYTVLGRERLGDGAWTSPVDARHRFFKVRVEMAPR